MNLRRFVWVFVAVAVVATVFSVSAWSTTTARDLSVLRKTVAASLQANGTNSYTVTVLGQKKLCVDVDSWLHGSGCSFLTARILAQGSVLTECSSTAFFITIDDPICCAIVASGTYAIQITEGNGEFCPYYNLTVSTSLVQSGGQLTGFF
jgi:hypothetical protein